jgi:hypothetical protein
VYQFADSRFAFLFLLARFREIDAIALDRDDGDAFLQRIEAMGPLPVVAYSGRDLGAGANIAMNLTPYCRDSPDPVS